MSPFLLPALLVMQTIGAWPTELVAFIITARAATTQQLHNPRLEPLTRCRKLLMVEVNCCHRRFIGAGLPPTHHLYLQASLTGTRRGGRIQHAGQPIYQPPTRTWGESDRIYQLLNKMPRAGNYISVNCKNMIGRAIQVEELFIFTSGWMLRAPVPDTQCQRGSKSIITVPQYTCHQFSHNTTLCNCPTYYTCHIPTVPLTLGNCPTTALCLCPHAQFDP